MIFNDITLTIEGASEMEENNERRKIQDNSTKDRKGL